LFQFDHDEIAAYLLHQNANVNACNVTRSAPLHTAAMYGSVNTLKVLIDNKADLRLRNNIARTALHNAAQVSNINFTLDLIFEI